MARSPSLRRLRRFADLDWESKGLVVEAAFALLVARLLLLLVPFPLIARRMGSFVPPSDPRVTAANAAGDLEQKRVIATVGWAVAAAARNVPFSAVCLPQAMAAKTMLERRGIVSVMHFGAGFGKVKPIDAHAWLDAAGLPVTGYPISPGIAEIACFV
jgi:hypothetical protein